MMTRFPICPIRTVTFPKVTTQFGTNWGLVNNFRSELWPHRVLVEGPDTNAAVAWCYENIGPKLVEVDINIKCTDEQGSYPQDNSIAYWTTGRWDYLFVQRRDWFTRPMNVFWFESDIEATAFRLAFGAAE